MEMLIFERVVYNPLFPVGFYVQMVEAHPNQVDFLSDKEMYSLFVDVEIPDLRDELERILQFLDSLNFEVTIPMLNITDLLKFPCQFNIPVLGNVIEEIWGT